MPRATAATNRALNPWLSTPLAARNVIHSAAAMPHASDALHQPAKAAVTAASESGIAAAAASRTANHGVTAPGDEFVCAARNSRSTSGYRSSGFRRIAAWNSASNENALWRESRPAKKTLRRRTRNTKPPPAEASIHAVNAAVFMPAGQIGQ